jgi:hypothetical protein
MYVDGVDFAQRIFISKRYGALTGPFVIIIIIIIINPEGLGLAPLPEP